VNSFNFSALTVSKRVFQLNPTECLKLEEFFAGMQADHFDGLRIHFQIGKNLFSNPLHFASSTTTLQQAFKSKRQFHADLTEANAKAFKKFAEANGFVLADQYKYHVVHLFNLETDEKSSFYYASDDVEETEKTKAMQESVFAVLRSKTYYDVLNIDSSATQERAKKAFKFASLQVHPDKNR